jgi:hypothetical protein
MRTPLRLLGPVVLVELDIPAFLLELAVAVVLIQKQAISL